MKIPEFSNQFDTLFNNITSNQAPGLSEYEKSIFLTKAEKEITKNYFSANSTGNTLKQGFDDSAKRQADFSVLMKTCACHELSEFGENYALKKYVCKVGSSIHYSYTIVNDDQVTTTLDGEPYNLIEGVYDVTFAMGVYTTTIYDAEHPSGASVYIKGLPDGCVQVTVGEETVITASKIDDRSIMYEFPDDTFIVINEVIKTSDGRQLQVIPLRYDEYVRLMSKPFKRPIKNQAWRLMNSGSVSNGVATKYVEIITNASDTNIISSYNIRYVRNPKPIVLVDLTDDGLSIDGQQIASEECELDPILHEDVLQRAVELAKIAWQGDMNATIQTGQRSE